MATFLSSMKSIPYAFKFNNLQFNKLLNSFNAGIENYKIYEALCSTFHNPLQIFSKDIQEKVVTKEYKLAFNNELKIEATMLGDINNYLFRYFSKNG